MKPNPKFLRQIAHHKSVLEEKMIPIEDHPPIVRSAAC
jgi:hypothetical protein